jgi:hypothetical protein
MDGNGNRPRLELLPQWKYALYVCCLLLLSKLVLSTCNARHLKLHPEFINLISRCITQYLSLVPSLYFHKEKSNFLCDE